MLLIFLFIYPQPTTSTDSRSSPAVDVYPRQHHARSTQYLHRPPRANQHTPRGTVPEQPRNTVYTPRTTQHTAHSTQHAAHAAHTHTRCGYSCIQRGLCIQRGPGTQRGLCIQRGPCIQSTLGIQSPHDTYTHLTLPTSTPR